MIHMFKENPDHCTVQLNVYVPLNPGASKMQMLSSIMGTLATQVILDLRDLEVNNLSEVQMRVTKE